MPTHSPKPLFRLPIPILGAFLAVVAISCSTVPQTAERYQARIIRTEGGIPHIRADDLGSLGFGTLFAMAEDNLCILADQYLTFAAERSRYLGPGPSARNLDSDFLYQLLIDRGDATEPLPEDLEGLFRGAAAGYNHYLHETALHETEPGSTALEAPADVRCRREDWVHTIDAVDVKRVSRVDFSLAYMLPILVGAGPPEPARGSVAESSGEARANSITPSSEFSAPLTDPIQIAAAVADYLEVPKQGGSNAVAIGRAATRGGRSMLLANPHMPWNEPFQRFYPMHQTIPGEFDVLGANLIGRPRVGFGHTHNVAWTSTVSTAKRVSFYRLELNPDNPTEYIFEGQIRPMERREVTVRVRTEDGRLESRTHTFYSTHFGALLVESPFFGWTKEYAFAVRIVDAGWRGETSLADQYRAESTRELKAVHDAAQFLPVNLVAADREGEVLYADPGPIPNLPDDLVEECSVLQGAALDGTRAACQWQNDDEAVVPGVFGPSKLPSLFRDDYVTNSNDSYWLANPAQPLAGYPKTLGREETQRTLRTRSGLDMLKREIARPGGATLAGLQDLALADESIAGQLIRNDVVAFCLESPLVSLENGREVDLEDACRVLSEWDLHANLDSRGAHLFRRFLGLATGGAYTRYLPASFVPEVAFDPTDPIATPQGLAPSDAGRVLLNLAQAVASLEDAEIALDAKLGDVQYVTRNGERIPLHGGPEFEGIFNKIEAKFRGERGYPDVDSWSSSWILAVEFTDAGPKSRGILTYSLSADPKSPHYADQTRMYSGKQWLELPFERAEVEAAAIRDYRVIGAWSDSGGRD